MYTLVQIKDH